MLHIHYINQGRTLRVSDETSNQTIYIPAGGEQALLDRVWRILVRYDVRHPSPLPEPPPFNPHGFAGSWEPQSPGDVGLPVAVEETPATAEGQTLADCRDFLRSVAAIADRDGAQTNWAAVRAKVAALLQAVDGHYVEARDKYGIPIRAGDAVDYAGIVFLVADVKQFPHGPMVGIYDEPPGKHVDYVKPESVMVFPGGKENLIFNPPKPEGQ